MATTFRTISSPRENVIKQHLFLPRLSLPQLSITTCLLLFCNVYISNGLSISSVQIDVQFAQHCVNPIQCFTSMVQCVQSQEILNLNLEISSLTNETFKHPSGLFNLFTLSPQLQFRLQMDKTVSHYSVWKTNTFGNVSMTEGITDSVFYKKDYTYPNQFKTINEFYGTVEGTNGTAFVRAIVQFVDCGRLLVFAFVRHHDTLYQIRPLLENLKSQFDGKQNIHEIYTVTTGIDSNIFSARSKALLNRKEMQRRKRENPNESRYCLTNIIADKSFFKRMNNNFQQVVIYIKTEFMLANEIFANSDWEHHSLSNYKVALPRIDIDLTIAAELGHFTEEEIVKTLLSVGNRTHFCIMHLFTDRMIRRGDFGRLLGISAVDGAFERNNVGATTINECLGDPWKMRCLLTFPHELAHSFGSKHDENSVVRDSNSFLMSVFNPDTDQIWPTNLKLSPKSIENITKTVFDEKGMYYVAAKDWSKCGNSIVEEGEQCDEGNYQLCCDSKCRLKPSAECSPFNSLCCNQNCQYKRSNEQACMPWNYCNNEELFCKNKQAYCQHDKIHVNCDLTTTTQVSETFTERTTSTKPTIIETEKKTSVVQYFYAFAVVITIALILVVTGLIVYFIIIEIKRRKSSGQSAKLSSSPQLASVPTLQVDGDSSEPLLYGKIIDEENKKLKRQLKEQAKLIEAQQSQINELKEQINLNESMESEVRDLKNKLRELKLAIEKSIPSNSDIEDDEEQLIDLNAFQSCPNLKQN